MPTSQLASFIEEANNNNELLHQLQSEGANPIEIANKAGYSIDPNDLDTLKTAVTAWENSSPEMRSFLQTVSQNPELQTRLQQPGNDPLQIAAELGINLNRNEFETISHQLAASDVIELDDEALSQVTGGVVIESAVSALVGGFLVGVVVPMIHVAGIIAIAGAAMGAVTAVGVGGAVAYNALKD